MRILVMTSQDIRSGPAVFSHFLIVLIGPSGNIRVGDILMESIDLSISMCILEVYFDRRAFDSRVIAYTFLLLGICFSSVCFSVVSYFVYFLHVFLPLHDQIYINQSWIFRQSSIIKNSMMQPLGDSI